MILFVVDARCGGAQRMTLLYAKILREAGRDCRLLVVQGPSEEFELQPFIPVGMPFDLIHDRYRHLYRYVAGYVLRMKPDCVFFSIPDMIPTLMFVKICMPDTKIVFRECNMPTMHVKRHSYPAKFVLGYADALIAQTDEMKQEMCTFYHVNPDKVIVIGNPVDVSLIKEKIKERYSYSSPEHIHYVAVGRVEPQKDYITLLEAFALVLQRQPSSHLDIIGICRDRGYKTQLDEIIDRLDIGESVTFHGFQENPYKYIDAADVFVLSSVYEGLPNVMLEAMYLGKPVAVTCSIPYIARTVREGKNGYMVPVGSYTALAEVMIKAKDLNIREKFVEINKSREQITGLFDGLYARNIRNDIQM